jgi:multiple sugar transport system permease protein/arabinosaccharide transport system permease protein
MATQTSPAGGDGAAGPGVVVPATSSVPQTAEERDRTAPGGPMETAPVKGRGTSGRARRVISLVLVNLLLLLLVFFTLAPYVFMWTSSFKENSEIFASPIVWWPANPTGKNYQDLFGLFPNAWRWYVNTAVVATVRTALGVFLASLAGFAFAKYDFKFKNILFVLMLATSLIPFWVTVVPLFLQMIWFRWFNTYWAVIIPGAVGAFSIFWMRQYATTVPDELMDQARIDGASEWQIFRHVAIPLLMPGIAVIAILGFTGAWNDFFWPLLVLTDTSMWLVNIAVAALVGPYDFQYGILLAAATLGSIPIIIVFLIFQRQMISGLTSGAFKGL